MALAHRESAKPVSTSNTTSCTITIPASVATDDLIFLLTVNRGASADPTVADDDTGGNTWTRIAGDNAGVESASVDLWWKRATSGTASKTVTVSNCTDSCTAVLSAFSGGKTTDPPYENVTLEINASGDETNAGFTPSVDGCMICLAVGQVAEDTSVSTQSSTDPGALTEFIEHLNNAGGGAKNHSGSSIAGALQTTAGATGNLTWAQTNRVTISVGWNILPFVASGVLTRSFGVVIG